MTDAETEVSESGIKIDIQLGNWPSRISRTRRVRDTMISALRSWWYWQSSQGAQRIREKYAIDAVVELMDPFWREHDRERIQRSIARPAWWWGNEMPERTK